MTEPGDGSALVSYLPDADRELIERSAFDPALKPSFEVIKSCLIWRDECPPGLSRKGTQFVARLWVFRAFLHQGIARERWTVDPTPFENAWHAAQLAGLKWSGFLRLQLSEEDSQYLQRSLQEVSRDGVDY